MFGGTSPSWRHNVLEAFGLIIQQEHRSKRFLTFPRTSPTRLQMIVGIGIPVELEIESVTVGWVNKVEFFLPENATNFLSFINDPYDLTTRPITGFYVRKKRDDFRTIEVPKPTENPAILSVDSETNEKIERYEANAEVVESGTDTDDEDEMTEADYWNQEDHAEWIKNVHPKKPKKISVARWGIYKSIALLSQRQGLDGKSCVLRGICESAHTSFDYSNGILGELMHILMTPSLTDDGDEIVDHDDNEYFHAEKLGKEGAPCEHIFKECKISILDKFSGIYSDMIREDIP
ncbi:uncharacterized protein LOC116339695 [Contarinia nasturtii]|uniref:uncharacterized protein LOC116339695 n=1 Tax=Contarinia nasturtii TaxID=265458 RepID=UPI0012D462B7|nr:uncharacterized protein LOC116339695 [Contarinia nasturtii]